MSFSRELSSAFCGLALAAVALPANASLHLPTTSPRALDSIRAQFGSVPSTVGADAEGDAEGMPNMTCIPQGVDPVKLPLMRYPTLNRAGQVQVKCWEEGIQKSDFPLSFWVNALGMTAREPWANWAITPDQTFFISNEKTGESPVYTVHVTPAVQAAKVYIFEGIDPSLGCVRYDFEAIAGVPTGLPGRVVTGRFVVCSLEAVQRKLDSSPAASPKTAPPAARP